MNPLSLLICCLTFASHFPKEDSGGRLVIRFEGIEKVGGTIRLALYDASADFMVDDKAVLYNFPAEKLGTVEGQIAGLGLGNYAFAVFLDENNNKRLDKNLFGVPTEPYGFSKTPPSKWRLPTWEEVRFEVGKSEQILLVSLKRWALL